MGALFKGVCYPSQEQARAEACTQFDAKVMATTNLYTTECTSTVFTGVTMALCKRTNGGTCAVVNQPWPVTPACDHDGGVSLSLDYFYAALGFIVVVWGLKRLLQLFDRPTIE
jgi:hypothetical protein